MTNKLPLTGVSPVKRRVSTLASTQLNSLGYLLVRSLPFVGLLNGRLYVSIQYVSDFGINVKSDIILFG